MEAGHRLPALGINGALGIRRTTLCVLPPCFLDRRSSPQCAVALDNHFGCLHLACVGGCWCLDVHVGADMARSSGCCLCGCALCRQSLPFCDRLLAERVCGAARQFPAAAITAVGLACGRKWGTSRDCSSGRCVGSVL